jgi:hypothetical protein
MNVKSTRAQTLGVIDPWDAGTVLGSRLPDGGAGTVITSDRACFVYVGYIDTALVLNYVDAYMTVVGAGTQAAEVGLFSSPSAPNAASQVLTKIVADATLTDMTATGTAGRIRNTTALATTVSGNTHLWAGIRCAMVTTQPTFRTLLLDVLQGNILFTNSAGALTGAGPWTGTVPTISVTGLIPNLRVTVN